MTEQQKNQIEKLLSDWHEAGRAYFENYYSNLVYDSAPYLKTAKEKSKYICLDEGTSGAFILEKSTLTIYCIKSKYGVPNFKKPIGHLDTVTGAMLDRFRYGRR